MKPISKLKEQARLCEQKEEWAKAAQLYLQVLNASEAEGDTNIELGLYNRIGDLYLKLGKAADAVTFYEQAADRYSGDGLFNNAIALCNKALRHAPDRLSLYHKLGRLSASQGFHTEARRWFFEFAERQIKRGNLDEAFAALRELADRSDDAEVRALLARQLRGHGRAAEAVIELRRAYASRVRAGDRVSADALREEVRTLDPLAADTLDQFVEEVPASEDLGDALPYLEELSFETAAGAAGIGVEEGAEEELEPPAPAPLSVQPEEPPEAAPPEPLPVTGLESAGRAPTEAPPAALPPLELEPAELPVPEPELKAAHPAVPAPEPLPFLEPPEVLAEAEPPEAGAPEAPAPLPLTGLAGETEVEEEEEEEAGEPEPLPLLIDGSALEPPLPLPGAQDFVVTPLAGLMGLEPPLVEGAGPEPASAGLVEFELSEQPPEAEPTLPEGAAAAFAPGESALPEAPAPIEIPAAEPTADLTPVRPVWAEDVPEATPAAAAEPEAPPVWEQREPAWPQEAPSEPAASTPQEPAQAEAARPPEALAELGAAGPAEAAERLGWAPEAPSETPVPAEAVESELVPREVPIEAPSPTEAVEPELVPREVPTEAPSPAEAVESELVPREVPIEAPAPAKAVESELVPREAPIEAPSPAEAVRSEPGLRPEVPSAAEPAPPVPIAAEAPAAPAPIEAEIAWPEIPGGAEATAPAELELAWPPPETLAPPAPAPPTRETLETAAPSAAPAPVPALPEATVPAAAPALEPAALAPEPAAPEPAAPTPAPAAPTSAPAAPVQPEPAWPPTEPLVAEQPPSPEPSTPKLGWASFEAAEPELVPESRKPAPTPGVGRGEPPRPRRKAKEAKEPELPAPAKLTAAPLEPSALPAFGDQDFLDALENARSLYRQGQLPAGRAEMEQLYAEAEAAGDDMRAMAVLDAFLEFEPFDVAASEQRVELRVKIAGPRGSVDALLGLAEALEHSGLEAKASAVYQQVLDIDPSNAAAGAALRREREHLPKPRDEGGFIDLGALLLDDEEPDTTRFVIDSTPTGNEEQDFVEMLEQFKDKVAEHMGEDPQAHYDLGLAYKEMGLVDEAIEEFQIALRCGQDRLMVYEELGRCFLLKEKPSIALRVLQQALDSPHEQDMDCMGVYYLLGRCHEELGNAQAARDAYERVVGLDMQFQDVAERLARL